MLTIIISILSILSIVLFIYGISIPDENCPNGGWHEWNEIKSNDEYYKKHKSAGAGADFRCSKCGKIIRE